MISSTDHNAAPAAVGTPTDTDIDIGDLLLPVLLRWKTVVVGALIAGAAAVGLSYLVKPVFTATTTFLPPQQQASAATALASLGSLAGLATTAAGLRNPIDQYIALLQSTAIRDKLIDQFDLMAAYEEPLRTDARAVLGRNVRISAGKRDGIITVEVDDTNPQRAAAIGNRHVTELQTLTGRLALTEAQQRRVFFEQQLQRVRDKLAAAQQALEASGFSANVLRAEPKAAAEAYAKLRAELTAADVRMSSLRSRFVDGAPEIQQQASIVSALQSQVAKAEASSSPVADSGYISRYREFKYQETLFELFARQYEIARLDESRDGSMVQVIDPGTPPERKSRPKRAMVGVLTTLGAALLLSLWFMVRHQWRKGAASPQSLRRRLRAAKAGRP